MIVAWCDSARYKLRCGMRIVWIACVRSRLSNDSPSSRSSTSRSSRGVLEKKEPKKPRPTGGEGEIGFITMAFQSVNPHTSPTL